MANQKTLQKFFFLLSSNSLNSPPHHLQKISRPLKQPWGEEYSELRLQDNKYWNNEKRQKIFLAPGVCKAFDTLYLIKANIDYWLCQRFLLIFVDRSRVLQAWEMLPLHFRKKAFNKRWNEDFLPQPTFNLKVKKVQSHPTDQVSIPVQISAFVQVCGLQSVLQCVVFLSILLTWPSEFYPTFLHDLSSTGVY